MDDEASIRALHAEHGGFLLRYALYLTAGNRHRAEELVHETILRAWRQAAARTGKPPARPWLLTVARNLAGMPARRPTLSRAGVAGNKWN